MAQLIFLEYEDADKDITIYINSPGGIVSAGLAIYDTIQYIKPNVCTICIGQAASMAAILLAAGTKGKRYALPHSRIMLHQPAGGAGGQAADIAIHAKEIMRIKESLNNILIKHTSQSIEVIKKDTDRNFYMDATEAKTYGIIDEILVKRKIKRVRSRTYDDKTEVSRHKMQFLRQNSRCGIQTYHRSLGAYL